MEYKEDSIIPLKENGETIYLKVIATKDSRCKDCYFYEHKCHCSTLKHIIGNCAKSSRKDNKSVIFEKINNTIMKKTMSINIYVVMQVHNKYGSSCNVFTSFEEANARFEELLKYFENFNNIHPKDLISNSIPSQIKVSVIGDITLYLCKETKEIEIKDFPKSISEESKVKHFLYAYECLKENVKHVPFNILVDKDNHYHTILDITEHGIYIMNDNKIKLINFKDANVLFKYLDGSPFGLTK